MKSQLFHYLFSFTFPCEARAAGYNLITSIVPPCLSQSHSEVEFLHNEFLRLPIHDLRQQTFHETIHFRHIRLPVKPGLGRHIGLVKTAPRGDVDMPQVLRLITDAATTHLNRHAPNLVCHE